MKKEQEFKQKILIADDSEMNRLILTDMLEDEYEIIEAENGVEAEIWSGAFTYSVRYRDARDGWIRSSQCNEPMSLD